jgi:hypothetical protein
MGVSFAAVCVWLGVRIYNRRERWAKWTLAASVALPVLYVAGFGPIGKLDKWLGPGLFRDAAEVIYTPLAIAYQDGPPRFRDAINLYTEMWGF